MAHVLRAEETQGNQALPSRVESETSQSQSQSDYSAFEYSPFEDNFSVRILTLAPGTGDDALVGSLSVENLDVNPRYEAISYVWGTEGRCAEIICNGRPLPLTRSIEGALRRLRHATLPRRLWADQICINQDDIAERSRQVGLMNSIYKGAEHVLVWLGPDDERVADDAVKMIHYLRDVFADDEQHESFKLAHSEELLQQDQSLWVPLSKLTKLPWFNRIWIVQEIGTRTSATLYWGDAEVDWDTLSHVADVLNKNYHYLRSRFSIFTPSIRYLRRRFVEPDDDDDVEDENDINQNRSSFIHQLHRARHLRAKDPRDHVYAFLGHFSIQRGSKALAELKADYSRSIEDIFYEVAARELTDGKSLGLLSTCRAMPAGPKRKAMPSPDLPSWVPDWRMAPLHALASPNTPHRASRDTQPKLWIDDTKRALNVRGVQFDEVARLSWSLFGRTFQFRHSNPKRLPIQALWQDICRHRRFTLKQPYPTGGSALFAFMQTLTNACIVADLSRSYRTIPKSEWLADAAAYLVRALGDSSSVAADVRELAPDGDAFRWSHEATLVARYRKFGVTTSGLFFIGPEMMERGDVIAVLYGAKTPIALRKRPDDDGWTLVGECYVHGIMNGEALEDDELEEEEFTIL
ncbi:heterokaryon incompatibility protein-domain-containing protein [Dactylonectria macrodidyma]|uniref:Heterokaryon incompatibility protein-domain-containing protein n=1 Tax=Dactylonectria macrodidyma TaxID=307937 RepID=A0A9P9JBW9_9HYPO|nr:heterokaryon incompatibility protein-domain-containing protein [Dactylonectria macrodidyma]